MKKMAWFSYCLFFIAFGIQIWYALSTELAFTTKEKVAIVCFQIIMIIIATFFNTKQLHIDEKLKDIRFAQIFIFILFIGNLGYLLFFDRDFGRTNQEIGMGFIDYFDENVNLKPFATIRLYIEAYTSGALSWQNVVINLLGNIIAFMPFGYFLPTLFKIQRNPFVFFITMLLMILAVEVMQVVMQSGSGDIDDLLLNLFGVILAYLIFKIPFLKRFTNIKKEA